MKKLDLKSTSPIEIKLNELENIFPECIVEDSTGKTIDFEMLKQSLSIDYIDDKKEKYRLEWPGKKEAIIAANIPSYNTLRPVKDKSDNFESTKNIYIEGDNLDCLKLLQESYLNKVNLIYIDPPYNTGNDFVYKDKFNRDIRTEEFEGGQIDEYERKLVQNPESSGRFHSDWLTMMFSRLKLAKNLLSKDGLIFISIDNNEVHNLRKICDEIFGETNFRNQIIIKRGAKSVQAQFDTWDKLGSGYEIILMYSKSSDYRFNKQMISLNKTKPGTWNNHWRGTDRPTMRYELFGITPDKGQWRWSKERSEQGIINYEKLIAIMNKDGVEINDTNIDLYYQKTFKDDKVDLLRMSKNKKPEHYIAPTDKVILNDVWFHLGISSSSEVTSLLGGKYFDNPKHTGLIKQILAFASKEALILDFFSGSGTTADAVMRLNAEDGGNRKYILIQIPEKIEENHEARKAGYNHITDIARDRIRKVAVKIKEEGENQIDYGFRTFRLDSSNMQDVYYKPQEYDKNKLDLFLDNVKPDRTADDLLIQVMLDWGLPLSLKIEHKKVHGKNVFKVAGNSLFACFDNGIDEEFAKAISQETPLRIVFKDSGFKDDTAKINVKQLLKQLSPETEMKVI